MRASESLGGPIFVLGMNGSGTTMLLDLLSKHSEIYGFRGETKVLPYLVKTFGTFPILDPEGR
jgi:hypothetical protein